MTLSDEEAQEYAAERVLDWAAEACSDMLGIVECYELEPEDAEKVMFWIDRARVDVTFSDEVD